MSILANAVQFYAKTEIIGFISRKSFWPEPEVDAAVIKITPEPPLMADSETFFKIVRAGFLHPRKQLINNLSQGLKMERPDVQKRLEQNKIKSTQRAETLSVENWVDLTRTFFNGVI
jgi:16S rRNA (adenine1518-N6/adenine1519-N6)-dimethyltransferase